MKQITWSHITLVILALHFEYTIQATPTSGHKICVPEGAKNACLQMVSEGAKQNVQMTCIIGRDRLDCLEKIHQHNADFSFAEPEDMYVASIIDNKGFTILKEIRDKDDPEAEFRYRGVAVIRNDLNIKGIASLKGAKSCHTGIGRSVGYKVPLTKLTKMKVIGPLSDTTISPRENELKALSTFFSKACLVGKWAPDAATNKRLKSQYSNLCALCEKPEVCDYPDVNSGYEGALNCLTKGGGDIAWTKTLYVDKYFGLKGEKSNDPERYAYLCPDGSRIPLGQPACAWAARPWTGFVADSKLNDTKALREEIARLNKLGEALASDWFTLVLQLNDKTITVDNANLLHPNEYLSKAKFYDVIARNVVAPRRSVRWCLTTDAAHSKCKLLKLAAFSRDIRPEFDCVQESSTEKCLQTIRDGGADIIALDAAEAMPFLSKYNLRVIAAELYYKNTTELFAVAAVKKMSPVHTFKDLQGKRSCHSTDMKSAGWVAPVNLLLQQKLIDKENCDYTKAFTEFFAGGSCLFGMPEDSAGYTKLTSVCGQKTTNGFDDYKGPLKCLTSDQGDVAFMSHVNLLKSIDDGKTSENEIELLCPKGNRASAHQYETCNLGKIPPKVIVTNNQKSDVEMDELKNSLLATANLYGPKPELFKLFGRYKKQNNVILSNTATGLRLIDDFYSLLSEDFKNMLDNVDYCQAKIELSVMTNLVITNLVIQLEESVT
ncbi:hypothetical protein V9T40_003983 [Parthenolecanium corni]|uniref:Transferrin n=1 Tax=Parthenolecanium corni TaxID=536013 RepID=A0AAN9TGN9_9HEMI